MTRKENVDMSIVSDIERPRWPYDGETERIVRVEPATHEAPRLEGWECRWITYIGAKHPGDASHTTFHYVRTDGSKSARAPGTHPCIECGRPVIWDDQCGDYRHTDARVPYCTLALEEPTS